MKIVMTINMVYNNPCIKYGKRTHSNIFDVTDQVIAWAKERNINIDNMSDLEKSIFSLECNDVKLYEFKVPMQMGKLLTNLDHTIVYGSAEFMRDWFKMWELY